MTTSHTATLTIDHPDRELVQQMAFAAVRSVETSARGYVTNSMTVYHDRDQPYTARLTWQTQSLDLARASE